MAVVLPMVVVAAILAGLFYYAAARFGWPGWVAILVAFLVYGIVREAGPVAWHH